MIKARIFLPKRDAIKKCTKNRKGMALSFLIDKAKILDLLSLRFIEQNKIFYLMAILVLQKYILLLKYIN